MCGGLFVPHFFGFFFYFFYFFYYLYFFNFFSFLKFFFVLLIFIFLIISKFKKTIKKKHCFLGSTVILQICPSSIEFMSVTNVSNEMK